jgi:hypothetical protein
MLLKNLSELVSKIRESKYDKVHGEEFLKLFSEVLLCETTLYLEFDGDNYQSGKQYYISFNRYTYTPDYNLDFEIAFSYQEDFFKIYTRHHNGYWSPEYISFKFSEHKHFAQTLKSVLLKELGLN